MGSHVNEIKNKGEGIQIKKNKGGEGNGSSEQGETHAVEPSPLPKTGTEIQLVAPDSENKQGHSVTGSPVSEDEQVKVKGELWLALRPKGSAPPEGCWKVLGAGQSLCLHRLQCEQCCGPVWATQVHELVRSMVFSLGDSVWPFPVILVSWTRTTNSAVLQPCLRMSPAGRPLAHMPVVVVLAFPGSFLMVSQPVIFWVLSDHPLLLPESLLAWSVVCAANLSGGRQLLCERASCGWGVGVHRV